MAVPGPLRWPLLNVRITLAFGVPVALKCAALRGRAFVGVAFVPVDVPAGDSVMLPDVPPTGAIMPKFSVPISEISICSLMTALADPVIVFACTEFCVVMLNMIAKSTKFACRHFFIKNALFFIL